MPLCSVPGCYVSGVHLFPREAKLKKQWEIVIRRKNFVSTENSRLCRNHFKESDYVGESAYTGRLQQRKFLKKGTIPSIFPWTNSNSLSTSNRAKRYQRRRKCQLDYALNSEKNTFYLNGPDIVDEEIVLSGMSPVRDPLEESFKTTTATQTNAFEKSVKTTTATQTNAKQDWFSIETIQKDPQMVYYYTGIETYAKFRLVLSTLSPMCNDLTYRWSNILLVSIEDQLLITLIKLRCNKPDIEISFMFQISQTCVSNIFVTWINFMSDVWSCVDLWPSKNLVQYYMPEQYKKDFFSTRIIIDTTEFPICKPSNPVAQQATFSTNKNRNTLKVMVGSTPGGLISYISEAYGGSISDRQVIERSDLLHKCDHGDSIMANRDFNVQDIFAPKDIKIINPSFLKGKSQLQVMKDHKPASKRVHMEGIIEFTKTFKILNSELSPYYSPLGSKILFVCAMLCNFREKIKS